MSNKLAKRGLGLPTTNAQKAKAQQNNAQATAAPAPSSRASKRAAKTNPSQVTMTLQEDVKLMEEINRIKKIMLS